VLFYHYYKALSYARLHPDYLPEYSFLWMGTFSQADPWLVSPLICFGLHLLLFKVSGS